MTSVLTGMAAMTGCSTGTKDRSPDWSKNTEAVEQTAAVESMLPGSKTEEQALATFRSFYEEYSADAIRNGIRKLYADNARFGDPFHIVEGIDEIEHYFLVMAEPVEYCTFSVDSIQRSGTDYFARWTMELESKAARGERIRTIGISHIRFNADGKIIFQQDSWDSCAILDQ
jgi:hypothetical protein